MTNVPVSETIHLNDPAPDAPRPADTITVSQQSIYYFLIAVVFAVAGFIVGGVTFSTRGVSLEDIRSAAASGAREGVRSEISSMNALINQGGTGGNTAPAAPPTPAVIDTTTAPGWGSTEAKVTIIEYSDFECPYCGRYNRDTYDLIKRDYGDKVRYVFKHFPLSNIHPNAENAGNASECANEQGKFWEYHQILFANQNDLSVKALIAYGVQIEIPDQAAFAACVEGNKYATKVQSDLAEGFNLGISGTPTFFINGLPLVGAQPYRAFQQAIEQALAAGG